MDTSKLKQKAEKCVKSQNFELAQKTYQQILILDPKDIESRKNLRAVNIKILEKNGNKVPSIKVAIACCKLNFAGKNPAKVIAITDEILSLDPNNAKILLKQGLAALELNYTDAAVDILEAASAADSKELESLKLLTNIFYQKGGRESLRKAVIYAQKMKDIDPRNKEITDLCRTIETALAQLPFDSFSLEEGVKDLKETVNREKDEQLIKSDEDALSAIERTNAKIAEEPANPKNYEKLGDLYSKLRQSAKAKEAFSKALELNSANTNLLIKIGNIDINDITFKIQQLKEKLSNEPENKELKDQLKKLEIERYTLSVREFEKRVESQPTVGSFKFELAKLYFMDAKRGDDAIKLFQVSCKEPSFRTDSLIYLGKLFSTKGDFDLAISQFNEALKNLAGFDSRKKDAIFSKADALEKQGKLEEAKQEYQSILVEDIGYRDVSKRVEALKGKIKN